MKTRRWIWVAALLLFACGIVVGVFFWKKPKEERSIRSGTAKRSGPTVIERAWEEASKPEKAIRGAVSSSMMEAYLEKQDPSCDDVPEDPYYVMDAYDKVLEHDLLYADLWLSCVEVYHLHMAEPSGRFCGREWPRSGASGRVS